MKILKPPKLKAGDTIGIVAPAYPFPTKKDKAYYNEFLKGKSELKEMGFRVKLGKNIRKIKWWRAGTPLERAEDINDMYANEDIKAIIAHDGANDCITVLEHLDFDLIRQNPKPFIGFSNITNIHSALYTKIGLVGFHMGLLTYELGGIWGKASPKLVDAGRKYFKQILTSNKPMGKIKPLGKWESWRSGVATGPLFGGNLSMLDSLV
ncbi:LD-carboxypeptidase [Patescibacteria group bacterium]